MKPTKAISVLPLFLLIALAVGAPDEAMGRVTKDSSLSEDLIRVRLADIDCPETRGPNACEAGKTSRMACQAETSTRCLLMPASPK